MIEKYYGNNEDVDNDYTAIDLRDDKTITSPFLDDNGNSFRNEVSLTAVPEGGETDAL